VTGYTYIDIDDPNAAPNNAYSTVPLGINNAGQIVGYYSDAMGFTHGFVYSNGTYTTLDDPLGVGTTRALGINDFGQIVGSYGGRHGFLYSGGTYTTIDYPDAAAFSSNAADINNLGQIVGGQVGSGNASPFIYSGGTYTKVQIDNVASAPHGMNDSVQIVGEYGAIGTDRSRGFLYTGGSAFTDLNGTAYGINNAGMIVGYQKDGSSSFDLGYLYYAGTYTPIVHPSAINGTFAFGINDSGEIVGEYLSSSGPHGFLAIPSGNPAPPVGTTANMILRHGADGNYEIYNLGSNTMLAAYGLGRVGTDWQFVGLGGFFGSDTTDMMLRSSSTGGFEVYDISNNNTTNAAFLGNVGLDWQVMGFGNFGSFGETDMMLRNVNSGALQVYNINNN
jgi:probable HAF family extracellular repeat protein